MQQQQHAVLVACSTEAYIQAWDLGTGSQLTQYKTNTSRRNCCCQLGSDYIVSAQNSKDVIHFWTWHKDQAVQRCFAQEPLTAVAASPNGAYLAAGGSSGTLYLWDTASGALLRTWPAHYKAVSCVVFSDSAGVLVSAGEDTLVCAWLLAEVLDEHSDNAAAAAVAGMATARVEPLHTWSEHTLAVTSLHLGMGEGSALLCTASLDRSIKLWSLATGQLLRSITLPAGVTSVTLDAGEHVLLAGCVDGSIYEASLVGQQQQQQGAAGQAAAAAAAASGLVGGPGSCCYEGHTKAISSLVVTPDGEQLVSGSEDGSVRVWDLRSRQCLRTITSPTKAPVSAALLVPWPSRLSTLAGQSAAGAGAGAGAGASSSSTSTTASGRQGGPKRLQPLAPLAKYAGTVKPWEGIPIILDANSQQQAWSSSGVRSSIAGNMLQASAPALLPQPYSSALQTLQLPPAGQDYFTPGGDAVTAAAAGDAQGARGSEGVQAAGHHDELSQLKQQVQQLQQQLQDSQQVAQQWQALHGQLHQFCTEQVLSSTQ